jgi:transcriptional regulator with XRE-family HTH domain
MATTKPDKASAEFIRLLKKAMEEHPEKPSLREVARRADLSASYLSFLLNGERPVPSNDAIKKLQQVLNIPDNRLFEAAGRPNDQALEFFRKEESGPIMRTLAEVPNSQLPHVLGILQRFVRRRRSKDI